MQAKLTVRLRDDIFDIKSRYRSDFPDVVVHTALDCAMSEDLQRADLIICDYISSPFFEALLTNKPVMLFEAVQYIVYNDFFEQKMITLAKYGFYRKSGEELAHILNDKIHDICDIWYSKDCQNMINDILQDFMNVNEDAETAWYNELMGND